MKAQLQDATVRRKEAIADFISAFPGHDKSEFERMSLEEILKSHERLAARQACMRQEANII